MIVNDVLSDKESERWNVLHLLAPIGFSLDKEWKAKVFSASHVCYSMYRKTVFHRKYLAQVSNDKREICRVFPTSRGGLIISSRITPPRLYVASSCKAKCSINFKEF